MTRSSFVRILIAAIGVVISAIVLVAATAGAQSGVTPVVPAAQVGETTTTTTVAEIPAEPAAVAAEAPAPKVVASKPAEPATVDIAVDPANGVIDSVATGSDDVEIGTACSITKNADGSVTEIGCS